MSLITNIRNEVSDILRKISLISDDEYTKLDIKSILIGMEDSKANYDDEE